MPERNQIFENPIFKFAILEKSKRSFCKGLPEILLIKLRFLVSYCWECEFYTRMPSRFQSFKYSPYIVCCVNKRKSQAREKKVPAFVYLQSSIIPQAEESNNSPDCVRNSFSNKSTRNSNAVGIIGGVMACFLRSLEFLAFWKFSVNQSSSHQCNLDSEIYQEKLQNEGFEVLLPDKATVEHTLIPAVEALSREDIRGAQNLFRIALQVLLVRAVNTVILASDAFGNFCHRMILYGRNASTRWMH
ncbi:unnamed protein product [Fraxinus pennsylvanica]|uniref:Uncharacterized protein n=1 Tax=Fraxinus pennsylvanica TaxID=56036 RepID=A0AAD1ZPJ8_9LAMI|nr:unnamed protein product [Fraxinus pennsylvanica]